MVAPETHDINVGILMREHSLMQTGFVGGLVGLGLRGNLNPSEVMWGREANWGETVELWDIVLTLITLLRMLMQSQHEAI